MNNSSAVPKFKGGYFKWTLVLNTNREKSTQDVLLVFSSGKREAVLEYLWLKFLHSQLTKDEFTLFIGSLKPKEEKKWAILRLLASDFSKKLLRKRLIKMEMFLGQKPSSKDRLFGFQRMSIEIRKEVRRLPKVKKFSGYIKSPSSAGSKRPLVRQIDEMVIHYDFNVDEKLFDWYTYLSVGNVPLLGREVIVS